jgi:methylthioribose-1-phosphate isomerase
MMNVDGKHYRTIWPHADSESVEVIDQTLLPHEFVVRRLANLSETAEAIRSMIVRGAPLVGVTAAYGLAIAMRHDASDQALAQACRVLLATRPTAVNLRWALDEMRVAIAPLSPSERPNAAWTRAGEIADEDVAISQRIGRAGLPLIEEAYARTGRTVNILTHCNAGWLATVDWGTATAPIYMAHDAGIPVHIWVDETRPRNQGASLTAYELGHHGVPHTIVVDNAGGHLIQHGMVDLCIVGTDRTTARGDVCNKIGTYLKALAAHASGIPFYVALPQTTIDWTIEDGVRDIPIEERDPREVTHLTGRLASGDLATVHITAPGSPVSNFAFDVTPAAYVTALITDRGICAASTDGLRSLFQTTSKQQ